jgi:hypothetical protein
VGVPILVNSGIYTFSRSKGVFAGVSLDGATITIADTSNHRVYGKYITGTDILMHRRVEPNDVVASFLNALATYSPGRPGEAETAQQTQLRRRQIHRRRQRQSLGHNSRRLALRTKGC